MPTEWDILRWRVSAKAVHVEQVVPLTEHVLGRDRGRVQLHVRDGLQRHGQARVCAQWRVQRRCLRAEAVLHERLGADALKVRRTHRGGVCVHV